MTARFAAQKAGRDREQAAQSMTREQVDRLEASLTRTPADMEALQKLQVFYRSSGQEMFGWNGMIARRLPHILWLIDQQPEHDSAVWLISPNGDPGGYKEAKAHWMAQAERPAATPQTLNNAARFLEPHDAPLAEQLLLRAQALDPGARTLRRPASPANPRPYWSSRLGGFYGRVLTGETNPANGTPLTPIDSDPYARGIRDKVLTSDDAALLASAGGMVARVFQDADRQALGKRMLERALALDPQLPDVQRLLSSFARDENVAARRQALRLKQAELAGPDLAVKVRSGERLSLEEQGRLSARHYDALASLPESERFLALANLASGSYTRAEYLEYEKRDTGASWEVSKKAAEEALALATRFRDHPDYGAAVYDAHLTLGAHALRSGNREAAVRHLLDASKAPPTESLALGMYGGLDTRLVNYLLKAGERETVVEFLERAANLRTNDRERMLADARAIRDGRMPSAYQYMFAREQAR